MRRSDKALNALEARALLEEGEYGVLSTVDSSGQPYGVPLNYAVKDDRLFFHCALSGEKLDNLLNNERVSFCVVGKTRVLPEQFSTEYESVILCGSATVVEGEEKLEGLVSLLEKYSADYMEAGRDYVRKLDAETAVVRIDIATITGKASPAA